MFDLIISDIKRVQAYQQQNILIVLIFTRSLWAIIQYRIANAIFISNLNKHVKKILLVVMVFWQWCIEWITTIKIPYSCEIGKGFYIGHPNNIILNANTKIGDYCNLSQGVTIGVSGYGEKRGVPELGSYVYVGANATIAGKIEIGSETLIAANSLVTRSFPEKSMLMGVPAARVKEASAKPYIFPVS